MARTAVEVKGIINDVLDGYFGQGKGSLYDREKRASEIEAGVFDYGALVSKEISRGAIPSVSKRRGLVRLSRRWISAMSQPLYPQVNLALPGDSEKKEDVHENFFAHVRYRMDPQGYHYQQAIEGQWRSRYGVQLLYANPYAPPKGGDIEAYKESYFRWGTQTLNPRAVGILKDDEGKLTLGAVKQVVPVVRLADYADKPRKSGESDFDFLVRNFKGVRGGTYKDGVAVGTSMSEQDGESWLRSMVTLCMVLDDKRLCWYIEQQGAGANNYTEAIQDVVNPFGRVPLLLYHGIERAHSPLIERYEGLSWAASEIEYQLVMIETEAFTFDATQEKVEKLPPDVALARQNFLNAGGASEVADGIKDTPDAAEERGHRPDLIARGDVAFVSRVLGDGTAAAYQAALTDWNEIMAEISSIFPSENTVKTGTFSSIHTAVEQGQQVIELPQSAVIRAETQKLEMIAYDVANTHKQPIAFRAYGKEVLAPGRSVKAGTEFEFTPEMAAMYPQRAQVSVQPLPDSRREATAAGAEEMGFVEKGYSNPIKVYEARGVPNATEEYKKDTAYLNAQTMGPGWAQMAVQHALATEEAVHEMEPGTLSQFWSGQLVPAPQKGGENMEPNIRPEPIDTSQPSAIPGQVPG